MSPVFNEAKYRALLEKLEIEEISLLETQISNNDFRIDSNFYTKKLPQNKNLQYKKIGDCLLGTQYGISIEMNENGIGVPIYRMNELHNMLCDLEVNKFVDIGIEEIEKFSLKDRDVLFNRTNSYEWVGRTGIFYKENNEPKVFASYLVRLIPDEEKITAEYLTTFLSSKYGVADIKRRARESINQTNVNPEEVKNIEIPILTMLFQQKITELLQNANALRKTAKVNYSFAEQLLLQELGLMDWQPDDESVATKTFADFQNSGRLDAEYYQPKYDDLFKRISSYGKSRLGDIVNITKSIEPGSEAYQEDGVPFVRVSDITKFGITPPEIHLDRAEYYSEDLIPKKNTILLSKDGSVGIAYKVENDLDVITSGALLHLTVKNNDFLPDYLTLVLNSIVVKLQAERDAGGSIIQHWKPSEIENVIIPKLPMPTQ